MATTALPNPTLDVYSLAPLLIINNDGAELVDGRFEGEGSVTFSTGNTYVGPFRNGYMEGNGTYTWAATGTTFQGDLKKNKIVGSGTYTWKSGCKYEGQVSDGLRHGKGTFSCAPLSSAWYEGSWNAGKMCGQGKLTYTDNASYNYEGTWREGLKNGRGIMRYASGNVYDGEWLNNVKHGHGVMQWLDRGETYEGAWQNGKPNGYGLYTWSMRPAKSHQFPTQNRYKGNWENGKRNGQGTFEYANGAVYTGDWKDDMKHGFGKYISENGRRYVGEWKNDRPVGGLEPYRNECPYTFHLADLLPGSDANSLETELQQVNDIVMRHIQDLRAIYSFYADNGLSRRSHKGSPMTLVDLCRLIKDCGVLDRKVTLADCTRIYARQFKDDDCHVEQYQAPHDPAQTFILHDFLHFLLRVSHLLYAHTPNLSLHSTGLAASFSHFIKHDLLPNITFHTPTDDITTFQAELRCFFEDRYADTLYAMYDERARFRPGKSLPGSRGDRTWTFRDVTLVVGEYGLLTNRDSLLTMTTVVEVLSGGGKRIVEDGCYNLEHEVWLTGSGFTAGYHMVLGA
ncbi:uncharacterized protein EV422DRAFT_585300 [Fimicolochytrium jonesii]|uniref:uncharacterized protein n=1 Tax=Fimicolochytrium jonesii TaxID=1396493 RepID=UPI0022FDE134|nr:uncharacterized protein EV422DRAFT_585300 [Fimicolochytrium jonesii]KAI8823735.1 hypothetical protein EV422DRAFT_585300 [Fimicolochytrium jonesii]